MNKEIEQAIMNARKGELLEIIEKLKELKQQAKESECFWEELDETNPSEKSKQFARYYKGWSHGVFEAILIIEKYIYEK